MHNFLQSTSLPDGKLLDTMAPGGYDMMAGGRRWRMAGRLDDGHTFERAIQGFVSW